MYIGSYKSRQLRPQYDLDTLAEIGREMASKGHNALKVEKERLGVSSLKFLNHFTHLEAISIYGISRDISVLAELPNLRSVALCSLSTKDVSFLNELEHLEELWIQGSRFKDWDSLRALTTVKAITLFGLRGDDFGFLSDMKALQVVHFMNCSQLKTIPDFSKLTRLRRLVLDTVNGLEDISGLAGASSLEDLIVMGAKSLPPEAFDCLVEHPTLHRILPGIGLIGSKRYKDLIARLPERLIMNGFYGTANEQFTVA